jgi:hypothetical protein
MAISPESKMRSPDRILVLKTIDDKKPLSSKGLVDARLFTGENKLHAIMDQQTSLWKLKYDQGNVPVPLQCHFTSFAKLKLYAEDYFRKRNIEIIEVKD